MIITLVILCVLFILLVIGKVNLSIQFKKEVKKLFSLSENISDKTYSHRQLSALPGGRCSAILSMC